MNVLVLGKITSVEDKLKFIIKATIPGEVEDVIAYPFDTLDQPEVGEEVVLFRIETVFGYSYLWQKVKLNDDTRIKVLGSVIDVTQDGITIKSDTEEDSEDPKSFVQINNDGKVIVQTKDNVLIKTDNSVDIETKELNITSNTSEFKGTGNKVIIKGISSPDPQLQGAFCAIPTCPFTGAPHVGNTINII